MAEKNTLLEVKHLRTSFFTNNGEVKAVNDVSFHVDRGEVVAIVGRCALDCDGRRGNDAACVNLLEVLLLQGTNIGKNGDEQKQNCR